MRLLFDKNVRTKASTLDGSIPLSVTISIMWGDEEKAVVLATLAQETAKLILRSHVYTVRKMKVWDDE